MFTALLLSILAAAIQVNSVEYFVVPADQSNTTCPTNNCHTLQYYCQQGSELLSNKTNVSLIFLRGNHAHNFQIFPVLLIANTKQLLLRAYYTNVTNETGVTKLVRVSIHFRNITSLEISSLSIFNIDVWDIIARTILLRNLHVEVKIIRVTGQNVLVKNCFFLRSVIESCTEETGTEQMMSLKLVKSALIETNIKNKYQCRVLNVILVHSTVYGFTVSKITFLNIILGSNNTLNVEANYSTIDGASDLYMFGNQNKLNIIMTGCSTFLLHDDGIFRIYGPGAYNSINIHLNNVTADTKLAQRNGTFVNFKHMSYIHCSTVILTMTNSSVVGRKRVFYFPVSSDSVTGTYIDSQAVCRSQYTVNITNTLLEDNLHCIYTLVPTQINAAVNINIVNSTFRENKYVVKIERTRQYDVLFGRDEITSVIVLLLEKSVFIGNQPYQDSDGIVNVVEIKACIINGCTFIDNGKTAIASVSSSIVFHGRNVFINNTGVRGGAMALHYSRIYMGNFSSLYFANNRANQVGGAIYVEENTKASYKCFARTGSIIQNPLQLTRSTNWTFMSNYASNGGDNIYGSALQRRCQDTVTTSLVRQFKIIIANVSLSSVTSNPSRVCLCNEHGVPECANMDYIYRQLPPRYAGELFTVSLVVVGYDFGTVQGVVYTVPSSENNSIAVGQRVQEITDHRKCTDLNITVQASEEQATYSLILTTGQVSGPIDRLEVEKMVHDYTQKYKKFRTIKDKLLVVPVKLQIFLEACPAGFNLTSSPPYICSCHNQLVEKGITSCIIKNHTGLVYRSGTIWLSANHDENLTTSFIIHKYCPHSYCKQDNISVDLRSPDTQCTFNHSGVLCGGCYGNLSLVLGTSRCLSCDNKHVSLLIVFIVAGFVLVAFIKILDLTVTKGTINGLLFYANIIWANKSILLPVNISDNSYSFMSFLNVFIAWLNLDLGIETCFFVGMTAYWKTWLQFLFPLYIWSITLSIIIVSHYSTRASKLFGNNSVPVLATLVLLSYTKLLRTIITAFEFSVLEHPHDIRVVWSFDGNVSYFGAPHCIIFLAALSTLLLLWFPFTFVMLTYKCLRQKSNLKLLRWINRWRPFFDAFLGKFKLKHQYWVGLLLMIRVVLLVLFALTSAVMPRINILAISIVGLALFIHGLLCGTMYKSLLLSILEVSYIANLTLLAITKPYLQPNSKDDIAVTYTSVGVVFVQFIATIVYHFYYRVKSSYITYKRRRAGEGNSQKTIDHSTAQQQYREPLLDILD